MTAYLGTYETYIKNLLETADTEKDWKTIDRQHERKIRYFQHERLIHLLVTLTTCLATLLTFFFTMLLRLPYLYPVAFVLLVLSIAYLLHYFKLENGVQRLYTLGDQIERRTTTV